jgi:hypothetical protein
MKNDNLLKRVMRNEQLMAEQFALDKLKIEKFENQINELKFCVYSLMFLNSTLLIAMAFF